MILVRTAKKRSFTTKVLVVTVMVTVVATHVVLFSVRFFEGLQGVEYKYSTVSGEDVGMGEGKGMGKEEEVVRVLTITLLGVGFSSEITHCGVGTHRGVGAHRGVVLVVGLTRVTRSFVVLEGPMVGHDAKVFLKVKV